MMQSKALSLTSQNLEYEQTGCSGWFILGRLEEIRFWGGPPYCKTMRENLTILIYHILTRMPRFMLDALH